MSVGKTSPFVHMRGEGALLDHLRDPLQRALEDQRRHCLVSVEAVGRVGEVMVSVTTTKGRLPMLFGSEDLDPGYVTRVVLDTVTHFGL
jgi:hypothetical protein